MEPIVTQELHDTLLTHKNIKEVHFTSDGRHHFRAFDHKGSLYTRLRDVPERSANGILTGKSVKDAIRTATDAEDTQFKIVSTLTPEQVLAIKPVAGAGLILPQVDLTKEAILSLLEISDDELKALLAAKAKGGKK